MEPEDNVVVVEEDKKEAPDLSVLVAAVVEKDNEINRLKTELDTKKDTTQADKDERANLQIELGKQINERNAMAKERDDALTAKASVAEESTKATRALQKDLKEAQDKIDAFEAERESLKATNTKLTVLTSEFPNLVRFSRWIEASADAEVVRASARDFEKTREADLEDFAKLTGTTSLTKAVGTPTKSTDVLDPENMRRALDEAYATGGETAYEKKVREFQTLVGADA